MISRWRHCAVMASDSSSDSEDLYYGTHISDDDDRPVKSRAEQRLRQNDPHRQAKFQHLHEQQVHDAGVFRDVILGFVGGRFPTAVVEPACRVARASLALPVLVPPRLEDWGLTLQVHCMA